MDPHNLDLLVLNAACDDWENAASIRDDVQSAPQGAPVAPADLGAALLRLVRAGHLAAHEFRGGTFVPLPPSAVAADAIPRLWYFTTLAGHALLDAGEAFFDTPSR
ncbi:MAG: hypothetical protein IKQ55_10235 [Kiritimatiellae bacterium]|nr:hypothetical protein [Kiritimatiellia bacterium]